MRQAKNPTNSLYPFLMTRVCALSAASMLILVMACNKLVDKNCPDGHVSECLANFETKGLMPIERRVTWGSVTLKVVK